MGFHFRELKGNFKGNFTEGDLMGFTLSGNLERSWFSHRDWSGELRKENIFWKHTQPPQSSFESIHHRLNHLLKDNGEHADAIGVPRLHALPGRHRGVRRMHQLQGSVWQNLKNICKTFPPDFTVVTFVVLFISLPIVCVQGVGHAGPSPHNKDDYYKTKPINETDNNGMDQVNSMMMIKTTTTKLMKMMITTMLQITMKLEQIYTTVDWPFKNASMNASLFQLGITDFASDLITGN